MKHNCIYLILIFITCSGCEKKIWTIDSFEIVSEIEHYDSIYSDKNDVMGSIGYMNIIDSVLIVLNRSDNRSFSFIDVNKGVLLNKWGERGQGPNEFVEISGDFSILEGKLVFLDYRKYEINYASILDVLNKDNSLVVNRERVPNTADFRPRFITIVGDKKIAVGSFKEGHFGVIDAENKILPCPYDPPFSYDEITGIYRGSAFQPKLQSSSKQKKFVISTSLSDIFEVYQVTDSGIHRVYITPFNHVPKIRKLRGYDFYAVDHDKSIAGLWNMAVSDELICFMYSSQIRTEYIDSRIGSNEILCFNWNGEKVKKYLLPFPVDDYCIDENYIYGAKSLEDEFVFYRFEMN